VGPLLFEFKLADFDLDLLQKNGELLEGDGSMLKSAVQEHLQEVFRPLPGKVRVTPHEDHISVMWAPKTARDIQSILDLVTGLIRRRAFAQAEPILRSLLFRHPDDRRLLFSLGGMLLEEGRTQDARETLRRLTRKEPDFAGGWNALGVVLSREGKRKAAVDAFRKSLALDPQNGATLRNLGALMAVKDPQKALPHLKQAAKLLPSDQAAQYVYGKCLMESGNPAGADPVLKKAIAINEYSDVADLCREARIRIIRSTLKGAVPRGLRLDVVAYCVAALEKFKEIGIEGMRAVAFEIASQAGRGLDINDKKSRFRLMSLPGTFTGLQLIATMYVGYKKEDSDSDVGIDFSREYELALRMFRGQKGKSKPGKAG
jgi:Flp pilus assembly protein TadD